MTVDTRPRSARQALRRRVIIAGAGVTGLVTAVRCALAGHWVTLLDRGAIPSPVSTSFDQHRAIRALDPTDPEETRAASSVHRHWTELETLLCGSQRGVGFYRRAGVVTAWPSDRIASAAMVAANAGVRVEVVEPEKFPHIRFPEGSRGLLEPNAGVLLADRVLRAAARWLFAHPAVQLRPWHAVSSVDADTGRVGLADGTVERGDLVLVACGPWSKELVGLPTVTYRQTMVYLRPPHQLARWWEGAPSAGRIGVDGDAWMLPSGDGTLLKVSGVAGCRRVSGVEDPEDEESHWAKRVMATGALVDMDRYTVASIKHCHYTVDARSGRGALVRIGPAVWARAASGGDGFRTAPLVADQIVDALRPTRSPLHEQLKGI